MHSLVEWPCTVVVVISVVVLVVLVVGIVVLVVVEVGIVVNPDSQGISCHSQQFTLIS